MPTHLIMMFKFRRLVQGYSTCRNFASTVHQQCPSRVILERNTCYRKIPMMSAVVSSYHGAHSHSLCHSSKPNIHKACYCSTADRTKLDTVPYVVKRIIRKKKTKDSSSKDKEMFDVIAYSTADKYNLYSLRGKLKEQGLYGHIPLPSDISEEALYVESLYGVEDEPRDIFFFKDGVTVFWNVPQVERSGVLKFLGRHQEKPYAEDLVYEEYDKMHYTYQAGSSHLNGEEIVLRQVTEKAGLNQQRLEKYSFSNALALSVSLSIWEAMLDQYVESIEFILQDLKDGKNIKMTERDVLRKAGHLLTLRHLINLRSDLLHPPDAYWDREDLEEIYNKTCQYLDIARRTRVMNEKLNHCTELTTMLQELLKDKHHTRLEWMIIILIMIEVVFEIGHSYERWHKAD